MAIDVAAAALRALGLVAWLQAVGTVVFLLLFAPRLSASRAPISRLGTTAAICGAALAIALFYLETARMAGAWRGVFDPELRALTWQAHGDTLVLQLSGLALVAIACRRANHWVGGFGVVLLVASFAVSGHTASVPTAMLPASAHVLLAAAWFGSLAPLYLVSLHEGDTAAALVQRFSAIAVWTVPPIAILGVVLAWLLGVRAPTLSEPYGALLIGKAAVFGLLLVLAAFNRARFGPRLAHVAPDAATAFRITVMVEFVLILSVLAITATLTTFFSPAG